MASGADDLPSCSKASTSISMTGKRVQDIIINKYPVVMLAKLDLDTVSVKLTAEDLKIFEMHKTSTAGLPRKVTEKSDLKSAWRDEDAALSDISACLSDSEETDAPVTKELVGKGGSTHKEKLETTAGKDKEKCDPHSKSGSQDPSKQDNKKSIKKGAKEIVNKEGRQAANKLTPSLKNDVETEKRVPLVGRKEAVKEKVDVGVESDKGRNRDSSNERKEKSKTPTGKAAAVEKEAKNEAGPAKEPQQKLASSADGKDSKQGDCDGDLLKAGNDADGSQPRPRTSSKHDKNRTAPKRSNTAAETDSPSVKKSKTEDVMEKVSAGQEHLLKNKDKVIHNSNARYKLALGPVNLSALGNESFRKFINLATDCVVSFNKTKNASAPMDGNIVLYFGDFQTLQSAMQRLGQLSVLAGKSLIRGCIHCYDIKPAVKKEKKDQWMANILAKLNFQFSAEKGEKLQQLSAFKSKSKEGTKRKYVHLHRIPSSITEEMLSLLFPFCTGVKISQGESSERDITGPVEIEFESQEWMEAVLVCFKDFSVSTSGSFHKSFNLIIKDFVPPKEKSQDSSSVPTSSNRQQQQKKQFTGGSGKSGQNLKVANLSQSRNFSRTRSQGPSLSRNFGGRSVIGRHGASQNRFNQRERTSAQATFGQTGINNRNLAMKRGTFDSNIQARGPSRIDKSRSEAQIQRLVESDTRKDPIRQLALSRGLDPNNPDVLKILEMTAQLESLQNLVVQQRSEAKPLGIMGLPNQQVTHGGLPQDSLQNFAMQQSLEGDARRFQAAMLSRGFEGIEQVASSRPNSDTIWQSLEKERIIQNELRKQQEAEMKLKEDMAEKLKRLEEFDLTLRQKSERQHQRKGPRGAGMSPKFSTHASEAQQSAMKILPFRDAPATEGLLGAAPSRQERSFEKRVRKDDGQYDQMSVDPGRNDRPLDFNRPRQNMSAEQAFNQDIERTRAVLSTPRNASMGRSVKRRGEVFQLQQEEARDMHALPVQFGKNAVKMIPEELERRRSLEMNADTRDEGLYPRNNDKFAEPFRRVNPNDNFLGGRDHNFKERQNVSVHLKEEVTTEKFHSSFRGGHRAVNRGTGSSRRGAFRQGAERDVPQRWEETSVDLRPGLLRTPPGGGISHSDLSLESGGINRRGVQRIKSFARDETAHLHFQENIEDDDFEVQPRRDNQNQSHELLMHRRQDLVRNQGSIRARERETLYQEEPALEHFHQKNKIEWTGQRQKAAVPETWLKSSQMHVEESEMYHEEAPEVNWHEKSFRRPAGLQQQQRNSDNVVDERSAVYRGANFGGARGGPRAAKLTYADGDYQRPAATKREQMMDYEELGNFEREHSHGVHEATNILEAEVKRPVRRGDSVSQLQGSRGGGLLRAGNQSLSQRGSVNSSRAGRGAPNVRRNVRGQRVSGGGRGLLPLPEEFQQQESNEYDRRPEVADDSHSYVHHQQEPASRNTRVFPLMPPPPLPPALMGQRSGGHGVNFF